MCGGLLLHSKYPGDGKVGVLCHLDKCVGRVTMMLVVYSFGDTFLQNIGSLNLSETVTFVSLGFDPLIWRL